MKKVNHNNLIEISKKINNPFSRETLLTNIKHNYGNGVFLWHDFGNGIASSSCDYKLNDDYNIYLSSNIAGAVLIFNLSNNIKYFFKDNKEFILKKNSFFIGLSSDNFSVEMHLKKNRQCKAITIGIKELLFLQLAKKLENLSEIMQETKAVNHFIIEGGYIDSYQFELLSYFENKTINENSLSNLHLESMALNLAHYTINKIINKCTNNEDFNTEKIESLKKAKQIILSQYAQALSIKDIANKAATNECYLKKDFKQYYGTTIYKMLQKRRLEVAKELLEKNFSVKETCLKVGYKHIGHFSKLFLNHFKISPSEYRKKINSF
ncbi:helix-turn-helix domain-containing protein [Malaciobacter canalis]|uniref:helix-turn-helix domain-containing protein n=1 Tax=Malaciobacter canalis TaxID=1912871 RepID=UPI00384EFE0E